MVHLKILPTVELDERPSPTVAAAIARAIRTPVVSAYAEAEADEITDTPSGTIPSFKGLSARESLSKFHELGINRNIEMIGSGAVVRQEPKAGTDLARVDKLKLILGQR